MMFSEHHNYKPICSMNLWIDLAVNGFSERVELQKRLEMGRHRKMSPVTLNRQPRTGQTQTVAHEHCQN